MLAELRIHHSPRVLEIGARFGTEASWFALNGAAVTAIDVTEERLQVGRARKEWLDRIQGQSLPVDLQNISLFRFAPAEKFDLIWMEMTFHHLEPRRLVYGALFDLLRPGGVVVICDANGWNSFLQLQFFLRRGFKTKIHFVDNSGETIEYGNERITTPFALRRGMRRAGFVVRSARAFRAVAKFESAKMVACGRAHAAASGALSFYAFQPGGNQAKRFIARSSTSHARNSSTSRLLKKGWLLGFYAVSMSG